LITGAGSHWRPRWIHQRRAYCLSTATPTGSHCNSYLSRIAPLCSVTLQPNLECEADMIDSKIRVLLIEDDLGDALTLGDGIDALGNGTTDVVLLDLNLPDSAGADAIRSLRKVDPTVPIVVLTSAEQGDLPLQAFGAGAQDYLDKSDFDTGPLLHRCL